MYEQQFDRIYHLFLHLVPGLNGLSDADMGECNLGITSANEAMSPKTSAANLAKATTRLAIVALIRGCTAAARQSTLMLRSVSMLPVGCGCPHGTNSCARGANVHWEVREVNRHSWQLS